VRIHLGPGPIRIEKEETPYDTFTREFLATLPPGQPAVVVSGYVALAFGRNRMTEDIDLLLERMPAPAFHQWWESIQDRFECLATARWETAFHEYLQDGLAVRFARRGTLEPNMEMKWVKNDLDRYSLAHRVTVDINGHPIPLAPLELQIAYKLDMGSEKDVEDARHLLIVLDQKLNRADLQSFLVKLNVPAARLREVGL
jgi:hypothetical protein